VAKRSKRKGRKQPGAEAPSTSSGVAALDEAPGPAPALTPEAETGTETEAETAPAPAPAPEPETAPEPKSRPAIAPTGGGLSDFYRHLHPRQVRRRSGQLSSTLGLGLATLVCLGLATLSGILLMFYYVPSVERAHGSVQDLIAVVPLGSFWRNLHRWSAHGAVACCLLHLLRTLLWGAFRGPRRRVWLVGVGLLLVTLATSFSGYLLPWDQDSYWTVTVGTALAGYVPGVGAALQEGLLGGATVGQPALTRFFVLHVVALPALGLVLLVIHLFRLRRAGGLARPPKPRATAKAQEDAALVPASPWLTGRELSLALLICIGLCLLSIYIDARLGPAPDLLRPDNPPKAPWFLVGLQELVSYSALWGGFVLPTLLVGLLALGPWLDGRTEADGVCLPARRARLAALAAVLIPGGAAVAAVLWWGDPQQGTAAWLNPATVGLAAVLGVAAATWLWARDRAEVVRSALVGLLALVTVFTVVGWFFRGQDWTLGYHPGPGRPGATHTSPPAAVKQAVETIEPRKRIQTTLPTKTTLPTTPTTPTKPTGPEAPR